MAERESVAFEETVGFDQVGLPPSTAVYTMLHRAAVKAGHALRYRIVVSNFDAAFRVVAACLGISVVPREVSHLYATGGQVRTVKLTNEWAQRRFAVCFRKRTDLTPSAERLFDYLCQQAQLADGDAPIVDV